MGVETWRWGRRAGNSQQRLQLVSKLVERFDLQLDDLLGVAGNLLQLLVAEVAASHDADADDLDAGQFQEVCLDDGLGLTVGIAVSYDHRHLQHDERFSQ